MSGRVVPFDRARALQLRRSRSLAASLINAFGVCWIMCAAAWWRYLSGGKG